MAAWLALGSVVAIAACAGDTAPTGLKPQSASFARSANAPVHQVTGGGKVEWPVAIGAGVETYGFTASVDGNGEASGQFEATWNNPTMRFHAEVTCLAVAANGQDAFMGLVVTESSNPAWPVGQEGVMHVRDNGEGANAPNDGLGYWVYNVPASSCTLQRTYGIFGYLAPWIHGNLQVR